MAEYPFTLRGEKWASSGDGQNDGGTYIGKEFELKAGLVIAEIEHYGTGEFRLEFVGTEGMSSDQAGWIGAGTSTAGAVAGAAAGAAIGSIVPIAGTIVGGAVGGVLGFLSGPVVGSSLEPARWSPVDYEGKVDTWAVARVSNNKDDNNCLRPGKYRLEVKSKSKWSCRFIQPALGQGTKSLLDNDYALMEPGLLIAGPFEPVQRPLDVSVQHKGGGRFDAEAFSVDGTHQCSLYQDEGQFYAEDQRPGIKPGKEYIFYISAHGKWSMSFKPGY